MAQVDSLSKLVFDQILDVLADPTEGFNASLASIAVSYGITAYGIDFDADPPLNFYGTRLDPRVIQRAGLRSYPAMTLYIDSMQEQRQTMPTRFDGFVGFGIDLFLSTPESGIPPAIGELTRATMDTLLAVVNQGQYQAPVLWGRLIEVTAPTLVDRSAEAWLQTIVCRGRVEVNY